MTPQEAIEKIKWTMQNKSHNKGLCNICIEALEKQIPKKPYVINDEWAKCPSCKSNMIDHREPHFVSVADRL